MIKILTIFFSFLCILNMNAQDTLALKNGEISTKLSGVKTIHYGNREVDLISSQNPRSIFPLGVNVGADLFYLGTTIFPRLIFNGSIDYLFIPNISAEINYRSMLTDSYPAFSLFSIGGKYWFANKYSKSAFSPFVGLFFTQWRQKNDDYFAENKPEWSIYYLPEVPLGISYISKLGFQTSLQLNCFLGYRYDKVQIVSGFIEFRLGWRFK